MRVLCAWLVLPLFCLSLNAFPHYLEALDADPMKRPDLPTACGTCHLRPQGGGERNNFGKRFEAQGDKITPMLRAQDPIKFAYPIAKVNDSITIHFSDPTNKQAIVEVGGEKFAVDVEARTVDGRAAQVP